MRITYIAAGAAGSYCGACARDAALARTLIARGHAVTLVPLYTPLRTDGPDPSLPRVFYGGVNAYLQQRFALFRKTPAFLDWLLDRPAFLKLVSRFGIDTAPEDLGPMTVSVLQGADGRQRKELEKLLRFLEHEERPDLVNLTNSLLSGIAPALKDRLGVPVVCTFQGEESFVRRLGQPHQDAAFALMRQHAASIDLFLSPGESYADEMADFLAVDRGRIRVVRPGIDLAPYAASAPRPREPFRIGFLSRISPAKGLDILCEAFRILEKTRPGGAVLAVAGQLAGSGRAFWRQLHKALDADGLADRVEFAGEVDLDGKVRFLRSCSVFCVPSRLPERRAVACIEALAAGVPLVVPDRGVFPELLALARGGVTVPPDDPQALADAFARLRDNPEEADRLALAAAAGAATHFSADAVADQTLAAYEHLLAPGPTAPDAR